MWDAAVIFLFFPLYYGLLIRPKCIHVLFMGE